MISSRHERPLRILFNLAGDRNKASSRVRGYWIAEELEKSGHQVGFHHVQGKADYLRLAARIPRYDVVVFQKAYSRYDPWLLRLAKGLGRVVLFDIDDAPSRVGNPRVEAKARQMMALSDGVLAGSTALMRLACEEQENVQLIPSGIRLANYRPSASAGAAGAPVCLGWIGNGAHYSDDLIAILAPALRALAAEMPIRLRIVGACGDRRLHDCFPAIPGLQAELVNAIQWSSPEAVAAEMAQFDIGLYPLNPGPFNDYKCGFKALEYMAMELPVLASDAANHHEIVKHEISGFLLDHTAAWQDALRRLIGDPALRMEMGRRGRTIVEDRYDTAKIADRLLWLIKDIRA